MGLGMTQLLEVSNLSKTFPGQVALDRFDLVLDAGRTHALVGQNGSGKSTFIKILAGYHQADSGWSAELAGAPLPLGDGRAAKDAGIRFVHQDLGLVDSMNAVENISMGVGYTTRRGTDMVSLGVSSIGEVAGSFVQNAPVEKDYEDKAPLFMPILNGSFMFAADLLKEIQIPCRVSFVKVSSYNGATSTGQVKTLIGHDESLFGIDIIIVEDIVDTGLTLERISEELKDRGAKSVECISLLRKQPAREKQLEIKYVGFELDLEFVVGYGLDYDGLGRNLRDVYAKVD